MSTQDSWRCSPDDGSSRAEVCISPEEIEICLWRCEAISKTLEDELRQMGLHLVVQWQGPCQHEGHDDHTTQH